MYFGDAEAYAQSTTSKNKKKCQYFFCLFVCFAMDTNMGGIHCLPMSRTEFHILGCGKVSAPW